MSDSSTINRMAQNEIRDHAWADRRHIPLAQRSRRRLQPRRDSRLAIYRRQSTMDNPPAEPASNSNSLGLDLEALKIKDHPEPSGSPIQDAKDERATPAEDASPAASAQDSADAPAEDGAEQDKAPTSPVSEGKRTEPKEKKKPYVNPERVRTGGAQRVCSSWWCPSVHYMPDDTIRTSSARKNLLSAWFALGNRMRRSNRDEWYGGAQAPPSLRGLAHRCVGCQSRRGCVQENAGG